MGIAKFISKYVWLLIQKLLPDVKEFFVAKLEEGIAKLECYIKDDKIAKAEERIIDYALNKITLPWYVKPFKSLIRKELINRFGDTIELLVKTAKDKLKIK